ncbi:MAG: EAL domain-containing protein [Sterolibacterium sp.]
MTPAALCRTVTEMCRALPTITGLQLFEHGRVGGKYYGATISSTFQPWRNTAGEIVAYEAYARSHSKNGDDLSPWLLFADAAVDSDLVTLDRLCRTVHALNFFSRLNLAQPLVLNVDARLLQAVPERHGEFFGKVLSLLGVSPQRIVIEIHISHLLDLTRLRDILASYRRYGFAVAVNAESMLHARSLASLLVPDYLMLYAWSYAPDALTRLIANIKATGVGVAIKHIESAETLAAARDAGVAWTQGFHLDLPAPEIISLDPAVN